MDFVFYKVIMKPYIAIILAFVAVTIVLILLRKRREGFQIFGAAAPYKKFLMNCYTQCANKPAWTSLGPSSHIACQSRCDAAVSNMVESCAPPPVVTDKVDKAINECGSGDSYDEKLCRKVSVCMDNYKTYCQDYCAFSRDPDCVNECLKSQQVYCGVY